MSHHKNNQSPQAWHTVLLSVLAMPVLSRRMLDISICRLGVTVALLTWAHVLSFHARVSRALAIR